MKKKAKNVVPLDTHGNVMPPPCPAEMIDRRPKHTWAKIWQDGGEDMKDCCVCGRWYTPSEVVSLDRGLVCADIQKNCLNSTLKEIYLCRGCRTKCANCQRPIPNAQKVKYERCLECWGRL